MIDIDSQYSIKMDVKYSTTCSRNSAGIGHDKIGHRVTAEAQNRTIIIRNNWHTMYVNITLGRYYANVIQTFHVVTLSFCYTKLFNYVVPLYNKAWWEKGCPLGGFLTTIAVSYLLGLIYITS